jgi:hypothetical protein
VARLEDLTTGTRLAGLAASGTPTVESIQWIGEQALKVICRDADGRVSERLLCRDDEPSLELVRLGRPRLARNDYLKEELEAATDWALVICDEAHRMSGHYFGSGVRLTRPYHLGGLTNDTMLEECTRTLSTRTREEVTSLLRGVKGVGPQFLDNFFLLRGARSDEPSSEPAD